MRLLLLLALALTLAACTGEPETTPGDPGAAGPEVPVYTVRGEYVGPFMGVAATIHHEAIPELNMGPMQMNLRLADPAEIEGLEPGTPVQFRMIDEGTMILIDQIEPLPEGTVLNLDGEAGAPDDSLAEDDFAPADAPVPLPADSTAP